MSRAVRCVGLVSCTAALWLLGAPLAHGALSSLETSSPVIAAAGDIACAPPGNAGTSTCRQGATSDLLVADPALAGVLTLGDNQYENGELANFIAVYDPTWGGSRGSPNPPPATTSTTPPGRAGLLQLLRRAAGDPRRATTATTSAAGT